MFGTTAGIGIICSVPKFKSYKPITEVVPEKLQQAVTFEKGFRACNFCAYSER
jgi:hypothetical protein